MPFHGEHGREGPDTGPLNRSAREG
jgi:hypothetical protein